MLNRYACCNCLTCSNRTIRIFITLSTFKTNITMEFSYEKLEVAKLAKRLITEVYVLTEKFPAKEIYGLVNQIRRAIVSVLLNIAEGSNKESKKDFNKFVRISIGSLVEVDCGLKIAIDLDYIVAVDYNKLEPTIKELYFKLIGLSKYLLNK